MSPRRSLSSSRGPSLVVTVGPLLFGLAVAFAIGLLIGADRERVKGAGPSRAAAGLRTFTVASLSGAVAVTVGGEIVLAAAILGVIAMAALSYALTKDEDPGITTEATLVLTTCWARLPCASRLSRSGSAF